MANLSRREREIMDILYRRQRATVQQVQADLKEPPGYSAVRALLRILVEKRHAQFRQDGPRYIYWPRVSRQAAAAKALSETVATFFEGSAARAAAALLGRPRDRLLRSELDELSALIEAARKRTR
jgi:predicted transcriptional regulator